MEMELQKGNISGAGSRNISPPMSGISGWDFGNDRSLHSEISTINFFLHRYESVALKPDSKPTIAVH